jgi:hypothetical protein
VGTKPILLKQRNGIKKTELKQVNGMKKTKANQTDGKPPSESLIATNEKSIRNINTLFPLFHQQAQYYSFQSVNPVKFQPPGMPATCGSSC